MCASLTEEAEAIGWYEQRMAVETDPEALAIMHDAQGEEFKHFSMDLEFLLRRTPAGARSPAASCSRPGDIVEHGEAAEAASEEAAAPASSSSGGPDGAGSLGIGSLRGVGR